MKATRPPAIVLAALMLTTTGAAAQTAADRIAQCAACHGEGGNSATENIPSLAGQPEFFLLNQLILIREGVRPIEAMKDVVKGMKDEDVQAIAAHFNKLEPKLTGPKPDPEKVARGEFLSDKMRCTSCHGADLQGQEQMPRIAKQRLDYMSTALKAYRDNKRQGADTAMTAVIFGASDADLEALAHYAASR